MTDRELLELAAKAAGLTVPHGRYDFQCGLEVMRPHSAPFMWNPLTDDGDALRLAVKLEFDVFGSGTTRFVETDNELIHEDGDPYAATRRAIVRAAAEIGREILNKF